MAIGKATVKAFQVGEGLSGLKTVIGVLLVAAAHALSATQEVINLLPDVTVLVQVQDMLLKAIPALQKGLELLGGGFLGVGVIGKLVKFVKGLLGR
jgi:hypothetical protein